MKEASGQPKRKSPLMCLILFAYDTHPEYRLILAANRDEYHLRPSRPLSIWKEAPILAGRDLQDGGTWLGISLSGRFAAVTNYREIPARQTKAASRGLLVRDFLVSRASPETWMKRVLEYGNRYGGFNLLAGEGNRLLYGSNRGVETRTLTPGIYGLSNHLIDSAWPKVEKGKASLKALLVPGKPILPEDLFAILSDRSFPEEKDLPRTGVSRSWERVLSPVFVASRGYGTRSSAILLVERSGIITFAERTFDPSSYQGRRYETRKYRFEISPDD